MKEKGFTLIELLVVIAIIGILSSVVLASLSAARDKAKYTYAEESYRSMETAFQLLYSNNGCWPRENNSGCNGYSAAGNPTIATLIADPTLGLSAYLSTTPVWPFSASPWFYDNDGDAMPDPCTGSYSSAGVAIFVSNATLEQYSTIDKVFDGDADPTTALARACGKIRFSVSSGTGDLSYVLSPTQ